MRRRDFIKVVAGSAITWPLAARAQQTEQVRRIGVLMNVASEHPEGQPFIAAFQQALQQFGWTEGRNIRVDIRWGANDLESDRKYAAELVALTPDVVLAAGTLSVMALQRVSRTLPIVFVEVSDPVGAGLVERLDKPGGSTTGFMLFEYSLGAKWIELLKQVAPNVRRAAVIRDSANPAGIAQFGAIRTTASSLGVDVSPIDIRDAGGANPAAPPSSPSVELAKHQPSLFGAGPGWRGKGHSECLGTRIEARKRQFGRPPQYIERTQQASWPQTRQASIAQSALTVGGGILDLFVRRRFACRGHSGSAASACPQTSTTACERCFWDLAQRR
jgi:ABC transporter substrate binding protein